MKQVINDPRFHLTNRSNVAGPDGPRMHSEPKLRLQNSHKGGGGLCDDAHSPVGPAALCAKPDSLCRAQVALGSGDTSRQHISIRAAASTIPIRPARGCIQRLLSLSLPTYRIRWTIQTGSADFQSGNAVLGRVEVKVPSGTQSSFDVPFIVGIP